MVTNDIVVVEFKPLYTPFDYSFLPCKEYIPLQEIKQPASHKAAPVYREIVFLQESDASEFIEMLNNDGEATVIKCLADYYDYGSGTRHKVQPWGTSDKVFRDDQYVLTVNFYIPYVSLYSIE